MAEMYRDVLQDDGFEIIIYDDAQTAAESIDEAPPDIIVLDMMLPGGNGAAFLQELRSYEDMMEVPVLLASSLALSPSQREALKQFQPLTVLDKAELTPARLRREIRSAYAAGPQH